MSKKLAIKGHSTRGKEVIELLEMMGGTNPFSINDGIVIGSKESKCYYVSEGIATGYISWDYVGPKEIDEYKIFTLEEFLEKYPFKIGDFVYIPGYESEVGICGMKWDPTCQDVEYLVHRCDDEKWYTARELLRYNPNKPSKDMYEKDKAKAPNLKGEDYSGKRFGYKIPTGYEFDKIENNNIILKPIKPKYPKTYKECCERVNACPTVGISYDSNEDMLYNDEVDLTLLTLRKLLICRNAYWKIAGEEMGLGKPWEPDFGKDTNYCIFYYMYNKNYQIYRGNYNNCNNKILAFPTEEMRDAFYKNFKVLIESCKELL